MPTENDPLIQKSQQHTRTASGGGGGYYFLNKSDPSYQGIGNTSAITDTDAGPVVEGPPINSTPQEFAPRSLNKGTTTTTSVTSPPTRPVTNPMQSNGRGGNNSNSWWKALFGSGMSPSVTASQRNVITSSTAQLHKTRKAPIKIEPKVFFSNERTFIAWMHVSVILAGGSIAILAFAEDTNNPFSQLYGLILLPVAISFIVYSMYQYQRRAKMIRTRHPGPYEDTIGPAVLGIMLMLSITAQFALKLYSLHYL